MASAAVNGAYADPMLTVLQGQAARKNDNSIAGGQDFGSVMGKTKEKLITQNTRNTTDKQQTAAKEQTQTADTKQSQEAQKPQATEKEQPKDKETVQNETEQTKTQTPAEKTQTDAENEISKEALEAAGQILQELLAQIEEVLGISEEDLLAAMQELGLQPIDLMGMDNMAQLMTQVLGEESTISLVMNEELYGQLQELGQVIQELTAELQQATELTPQELEAVLEQLRLQEEQLAAQDAQTQDQTVPEVETDQDTISALQQGDIDTGKTPDVPVIMTAQESENDSQTQQTMNAAENVAEEEITQALTTAETHPEHDEQEESKSDLNQQQEGPQAFGETLGEQTAQLEELAAQEKLTASQTPDTESILKQLADYVKLQKGKELTEMEMQLHPASLGTVKIQLATKGGVVTAQFSAETETVKNAIEAQTVQLRASLEEQGIKVEAIEVSVASHEMERNLDQNNGNNQENQQKEQTQAIGRIRRTSINLNDYADEDELASDMAQQDDATRIAMELMSANGTTMDLLA